MSIRFLLARLTGTVIANILRILPYSGGGAAPGLVALTLDPDFIKHQAPRLQAHIVVSGTNGKTTTTRMVSTIFKAAHLPHIHNRTGSNLLRGIASTFLFLKSNIPPNSIGLWEVDEAAFPEVLHQLKPKIVVLTNLFRDQLDRYGEIDTLAKKWLKALKRLPKTTTVLLNSDDATLVHLGRKLTKQTVLFYGITGAAPGKNQPTHAADATFCPRCLKPLQYRQVFYSHLGKFSCSCGFNQPKKTFAASRIKPTAKTITFTVTHHARKVEVTLPLTGLFNLYNGLAAVAIARQLAIPWSTIRQALHRFRPAFGRMESVTIQNKTLQILLVKNPTGFNQVIATLQSKKALPLVLVALNDNVADGTDVSWIWDVGLQPLARKAKKVIVTGKRAWDMAVRLKYASVAQKQITVEPNLAQALQTVLQAREKQIYLLPTYTAMLDLRRLLTKKGIIHSSWQD